MHRNGPAWADQFRIESEVDLDFVLGQADRLPVGMSRRSPPEFRRRILAALVSYKLRLKSIDYTLKQYVDSSLYESEDISVGEATSDYLRDSTAALMQELYKLHTGHPTFGVLGAELTLYRLPHALDSARLLANRGLLLEVLPILRLCLEMMAWASVAFRLQDEEKIVALRAQSCMSEVKRFYQTAGNIYGYLSKFSHWGHVVHGEFLSIADDGVAVVNASVRYRAMSLGLCLVILDVFVEVIRELYPSSSEALIATIQGSLIRDADRKTHQFLKKIANITQLNDINEICSLAC
jgi:hypothetical protein